MKKIAQGIDPPTLYVVATPIRNLGNISRRTLDVLASVHAVAAEDTHHTRQAALVREISKRFETVITGTLAVLEDRIRLDTVLQWGEAVIVVEGSDRPCDEYLVNPLQLVTVLSEYLPPRVASMAAGRITGGSKNDFYRLVLEQLEDDQR